MSYFTLLTVQGQAAHANAAAANTAVTYTHLALGDGNGADIVPTEAMTGLVHEVYRLPISTVTQDPDNPSWFVIEAQVPANVGGWTVREVGIYNGPSPTGKLVLVGNFPVTYKPVLSEGSGRDMTFRVVAQIGNASTVNLTLDPSVAIATNQTVSNAIALHEAKPDPHPQYALDTDLAAHVAAPDPHSQYLNAARLAAALSNQRARRLFFASGT